MNFKRKTDDEVVPNTIEEELQDGIDKFLTIKQGRSLSLAKDTFSPRYSQEGDVLERSILGTK